MKKLDFFLQQENQIENPSECVSYCRTYWKDDMEHVLRIAKEVTEGTFLFDLKYDLERTYEPVSFGNNIVWDYKPGNDPEFVYQLSRHRYFICLGQAYMFTGEEIYAETFVSILRSWCSQNSLNEETKRTTWRTIEAGFRGENWTKAIRYFKDSPSLTEEVMELFINELKRHGDYLYQHDSWHSKKSNWGVIEYSGLMAIGCALRGEENAEKYVEKAMKVLEEAISIQVDGDGVHWEQSPLYHNEVVHCCMESIRLARKYGYQFSETFEETIEKMTEINMIWSKPNHCQITQGDSDEDDVRELLTRGAILFKNAKMKKAGYERLDFDGIWEFGPSSNCILEGISDDSREEDVLSHDLAESGNYYVTGMDQNGNKEDFFHFSHGNLGGGHGHFDRLHVDLSLGGEDILVDAGRYTYVNCKERSMLKSSASHNVPMVDGIEYMQYLDAWSNKGDSPLIPAFAKHKNGIHLFQGSHIGYFKQGIFLTRTILIPSASIYIILDEFQSKDTHDFEQLFHFSSHGQVTLSGTQAEYQGKKSRAVFHFLTDQVNLSVYATKQSRNYNQLDDNQTIKASVRKNGYASLLTVITKEEAESPVQIEKIPIMNVWNEKIYTDETAEAVRVILPDGDEITALLGHKETGVSYELFGSSEQYGLGNIIVFKKNKKGTIKTVMR